MAASKHRFALLCVIVSVLILAALAWRFFPQPVEPVRNDVGVDLEPAVVSPRVHDDDKSVASMPLVNEEAAEPEEQPAGERVVESAARNPETKRKAPTHVVHGVVTKYQRSLRGLRLLFYGGF